MPEFDLDPEDCPQDADNRQQADATSGSEQNASDEQEDRSKRRPDLAAEGLEPRILLSATWVDADTSDPLAGATEGNDTFTGGDAADIADALGGDDILSGGLGNDILTGGSGDDVIEGGDGDDTIVETVAADGSIPIELSDLSRVSHWTLGDATDASVTDEMGVEAGTYNGVTTGAVGPADGSTAADFDGTDDYVEIPHDSSFELNQGAVHLSFNADDTSGTQGLFSKDSSGYDDGGHLTMYLSGDTLTVRLQSDTTSYTLTAGDIEAGEWYDVTFSFGDDGAKLFVDGVERDTDSYTGGLGSNSGGTGNTEPIVIGVQQMSSGDGVANNLGGYFDGRIADVAITSGQPSATDVANLHTATKPTVTDDDTIDGGAGVDTVDYSAVDAAVQVDLAAGTATGSGSDTISNVENVVGTDHDDTLTGDAEDNVIEGGLGDDVVDGGDGDDTILAAGGDLGETSLEDLTRVAHWSLGDATDAAAVDEIGVSAGVYNGPTVGDSGPDVGATAAGFDGVDDYVEIAHDPDFELDAATIHVTFNADDTSGNQALFSKDSTSYDDGGHVMMRLEGSTLKVRLQSDTSSYYLSATDIQAGEWNDVAFSFGPGGMELWVNGELRDTDSYTGGIGSTSGGTGNTEPITIGANQWQSGDGVADNLQDFFGGSIADVAITAGQVDAATVAALHGESSTDDDSIDGGSGHDTVSYAGATVGVTIDLTLETAQDTGGAGVDTLTSIEGFVGSDHDDTVALSSPVDGATYVVDGGGGSNTLDLSGVPRSAVSFGDGSLEVEHGGVSFTVEYSNLSTIDFSDAETRIVLFDPTTGVTVDGDDGSGDGTVDDAESDGDADHAATTYPPHPHPAPTHSPGRRAPVPAALHFVGPGSAHVTLSAEGLAAVGGIVIQSGFTGIFDFDDDITVDGALVVHGGANVDLDGHAITVQGDLVMSDGTLELDGSTLTLEGDVAISGGSIDAGTSTVVLDGGGDQSVAVSGQTLNRLEITNPAGTTSLSGDLDAAEVVVSALGIEVSDTLDVSGDLTLTSLGGLSGGGEIEVGGDLATDASLSGSAATIVLDGSADQALTAPSGTGDLPSLKVDKPSGTLSISDEIQIEGDFVHANGAVDASGSTIRFTGSSASITGGTATLDNVVLDGGAFTLVGDLDVDGDLSLTSLSNLSGGDLYVEGDVTTLDWSLAGDSVVVLDGAGDQAVGADGGKGGFEHFRVDKASGTVTVADTIEVDGLFEVRSGTLDATGGKLVFENDASVILGGDASFGDVDFDGGQFSVDGTMDVHGTLTLKALNDLSGGLIALHGDLDQVDLSIPGDTIIVEVEPVTTDEDIEITTGDLRAGPVAGHQGATLVSVSTPSNGTASVNSDGTITFDPDDDWHGSETISYVLANGAGDQFTVETTITVNPIPDPPHVTVLDDFSVDELGTGVLTATFGDGDGDSVTAEWVQVGGPTVALSNPTEPSTSFQAPELVANTDLTFELRVTDGEFTTVDTVVVTVNADDDAPSAQAGPDQAVSENAEVTLSGSGTDPEGQGLTYQWVQTGGPSVILSDADAASPTFTAPNLVANTDLTFELRVSDGTNVSVDSVTIEVGADDDAPTAEAGSDQFVDEGETVTLQASGDDPEGAELSYTWSQVSGPTVALSANDVADPQLVAPNLSSDGTLVFEVAISDGENVTTDTVTIHVSADNDGPVTGADSIWFDGDRGYESMAELHSDYSAFLGTQESTIGFGDQAIGTLAGEVWADDGVHFSNDVTAGYEPWSGVQQEGGPIVEHMTGYDGTIRPDGDNAYVKFGNDDPSAPFTIEFDSPVASIGAIVGTGVQGDEHGVTVRLYDADGTMVGEHTVEPQLWESDSQNQNYEGAFAVQLDEAIISRVEILNESAVQYANALIIDEIAYSHSPQVSSDFVGVEDAPLTTPNVLANDLDPEGTALAVDSFTQPSNGSVAYNGDGTFTYTPDSDFNGADSFTYTAIDGDGATSTETVQLFVRPVEDAATAAAGDDVTVSEGDAVVLSGSASDVDGDALTYEWVQSGGPAVILSGGDTLSPTFDAPEGLANTALTFELRVSDGTSTSVDTVTVHVNADNDAPSADAGVDQTVDEHDAVTLSGAGVDPEGQGLTYQWVQTGGPTVVLTDGDTASPTFDAPEGLSNADLTFELRVFDGVNTSIDTTTVHVLAENDGPSAEAGSDQVVDELDQVTLVGSGVDPEGQALTYQWVQTGGPVVALTGGDTASPTFEAPEGLSNTQLEFELRVSDGTSTAVDSVTVHVNADDDAPSASAGPDQSVEERDTVTLVGSGVDPEGVGLSYEWVQTGGPVVQLVDGDTAGPTFEAPEGLNNTDLSFELRVTDGVNVSVDTVTIHVAADDDAPSAEAGADQWVEELQPVTLSGSGLDPEGLGLTYEWVQTAGPSVALVGHDTASPTFEAPEGLSNTELAFELRVSDGVNTSVDSVTVHVGADDDAPVAGAGLDQWVEENEPVVLDGFGLDPEGQGLTFDWVQLSGPSVELSDASAENPSFTAPEQLANTDLAFELRVSDGVNTAIDTVTIHVGADNDAPSAEAGANVFVAEEARVELHGAGTDPEQQGLTYRWTQVAGPEVVLEGAESSDPAFDLPNLAADAELTFELEVSDGVNVSVDTVTVHVAAEDDLPLLVVGGEMPVVEAGGVVRLGIEATDAEGQELSYAWRAMDGSGVQLANSDTATPILSVPAGAEGGVIRLEVQVSDGTNVVTEIVEVQVLGDSMPTADDAGDSPSGESETVAPAAVPDVETVQGLAEVPTQAASRAAGPAEALESRATSPDPVLDGERVELEALGIDRVDLDSLAPALPEDILAAGFERSFEPVDEADSSSRRVERTEVDAERADGPERIEDSPVTGEAEQPRGLFGIWAMMRGLAGSREEEERRRGR